MRITGEIPVFNRFFDNLLTSKPLSVAFWLIETDAANGGIDLRNAAEMLMPVVQQYRSIGDNDQLPPRPRRRRTPPAARSTTGRPAPVSSVNSRLWSMAGATRLPALQDRCGTVRRDNNPLAAIGCMAGLTARATPRAEVIWTEGERGYTGDTHVYCRYHTQCQTRSEIANLREGTISLAGSNRRRSWSSSMRVGDISRLDKQYRTCTPVNNNANIHCEDEPIPAPVEGPRAAGAARNQWYQALPL